MMTMELEETLRECESHRSHQASMCRRSKGAYTYFDFVLLSSDASKRAKEVGVKPTHTAASTVSCTSSEIC